ncbi:MAG: oligosaccharide flippase family protein [Prevotellaceae bacterium]|jgi:O-antigen/teichoic acid export membrane protein|nr:oligosaccharide flippase family protein [Prevotellaceae bacterium]
MGIVLKQTVRGSIYTYIGAALGFITLVFIQPHVINPEQVGLIYMLNDLAVLFATFAALGFSSTIRYFPYFRSKEHKHHGYLFLALMVALVGFLLICAVIILFKDQIVRQKSQESFLFSDYYYYLIPLTLFFLYFNIFDLFARVNYNTVFSRFLREVLKRILVLCAFMFLLFKAVDFDGFMPIWLVANILPTFTLLIYSFKMDTFSFLPDFKFLKRNKPLVKKLINISGFTLLVGTAPFIVGMIDRYMVNRMYGLSDAGIYSIMFYFCAIITMPSRSLYSISTPVIAEAWKQSDKASIKSLYHKTCINQLIFAVLLLVGIWGNVDNIFNYLPIYEPGKYILFFIGIANVVEMGTGVNGIIIATSKYYRYDGLFYLLLIGFTIFTNMIFLPLYGMTGAAIATALTSIIFNIFRYIFVWRVFKMQPFDWRNLMVVVLGLIVYFISTLIPQLPNYVVDIVVRSAAMVLVFIPVVYFLKLSDDFNFFLEKYLKKLTALFIKR